ncbi:MAG TPA: DUF3667 domain-containing protein [Lacunisphaera sp.]|nr:DUF3667 domain-containing protein [Lacunisphaera sp.]
MSPDPELPPPPTALPPVETIALDQVAGAAAQSAASGAPVHAHCENCGTRLAGPYCHQCGQHDFDVHQSLRHLFLEAVDTLFNIEGRFFRSLFTLMFRPGVLTAEFNAGKRIVQMPPFRLYIFVSFLFFLVIFLDQGDDQFIRTGGKPHQGLTVNGQPVSLGDANPTPSPPPGVKDAPSERPRLVDQLRAAADDAKAKAERNVDPQHRSGLEWEFDSRLRQMNDPGYRHRLTERIQTYMPNMLMLCLPLFALYTRVLFPKSGLMYLQHLVLALHFHTVIYLWIILRKGWAGIADLPGWGWGGWVSLACNIWLWIYPLLMLRRLFANSWPWTLAKTLTLAVGYSLTIGVAFMLMAVVSVLLA